mgnify:CR=1 FL=1
MLFRSWLTFTIVIGVVQIVLGLLAILQHDAIFSELLRQRIAVIAQTTVASYKPIVDLGLPVSMIRNGDAIVRRGQAMDDEINAVHTFNPSGIIVHSTQDPRPQSMPDEVLRRMQLAERPTWSAETETEVFSGRNITGSDGNTVASVVVAYPKDRLAAASGAVLENTVRAALLIWIAFSAVAYLLLRVILTTPRRAIARLDAVAKEPIPKANTPISDGPGSASDTQRRDIFEEEIARLEHNLTDASRQYDAAMQAVSTKGLQGTDADVPERSQPDALQVANDPSRSLARALALRLAPPAAIVIAASAIVLGIVILRDVNRSIEPELAARANMIGVVVSENVQRAVAAGAPLDKLVGAENYFGDMLAQLPEVAYVAVATGRIVLEAGKRIDPYLAPPRQRKDVRSHPILHEGEEIAYVVIDIDPAFIAKRFRDVFLDMSVVVLVTILAAFEIMVLLTSRSLTAALDRLQRLAGMQAAGNFSKTAAPGSRGAIADLTQRLSEHARSLYAAIVDALSSASNAGTRGRIETVQTRLGLAGGPPVSLRVSYFTDIRLALFLFVAADELPLSFLPLYTRAAENLWPWLDTSVLISLPLAGYLVAIVVASPFSRALTDRFGVRLVFLGAALPTIAAQLGMFYAETAQEIIVWRTLTGIGYAFVTLACQDYVLDTAPPEHRDRTLGVFTLVLFGGIFAGASLGGVLADRLGQANVFLLSAALIAVSTMLSAWFIAPGVATSAGANGSFSLKAIVAPLRNARFSALVFGLAIPANVLLQAFISFLVALVLNSLGASTADIGRTLMLYFLGVIVTGPVGGRLVEAGLPVVSVALVGSGLAGAALIAFVVWPISEVLTGVVLLTGLGHGLVRGSQVSLAMSIAERELVRPGAVSVLGSLRTLERLGSVAGLVVIAGIAGAYGYTVAIGAVAAWSIVGALVFALAFVRPAGFWPATN